MPVFYRIQKDQGLVVSVQRGRTSDEEFIEAYTALLEDPEYVEGMHHLVDLRLADSSGRGVDALRTIAEMLGKRLAGHRGTVKTAIVAPPGWPRGMSRIFGMLSDGAPQELRVFGGVHEALDWLGVSEEALSAPWPD